jgi:HK97 gp10 family phage protein
MIGVDGLEGLARRLKRLDLAAAERTALEHAAVILQDAVRARLSHTPGEVHAAPWLRSGTLRNSVTHGIYGTDAVVGSNDPVAVDQEYGTRTDPPRPFLAPAATAEAPKLAASLASAVLGQLRTVFK